MGAGRRAEGAVVPVEGAEAGWHLALSSCPVHSARTVCKSVLQMAVQDIVQDVL